MPLARPQNRGPTVLLPLLSNLLFFSILPTWSQPRCQAAQDVEKAIMVFEHTGKIPAAVLEARWGYAAGRAGGQVLPSPCCDMSSLAESPGAPQHRLFRGTRQALPVATMTFLVHASTVTV